MRKESKETIIAAISCGLVVRFSSLAGTLTRLQVASMSRAATCPRLPVPEDIPLTEWLKASHPNAFSGDSQPRSTISTRVVNSDWKPSGAVWLQPDTARERAQSVIGTLTVVSNCSLNGPS